MFFKRPFWLLMAVFCIVFSSATKKLLEFRFERIVHPQYSALHLINKKVKNGCRDKRQYLKSVVQPAKHLPDAGGQSMLPPGSIFPIFYQFDRAGSIAPQAICASHCFAGSTPLYLRHRRLQV